MGGCRMGLIGSRDGRLQSNAFEGARSPDERRGPSLATYIERSARNPRQPWICACPPGKLQSRLQVAAQELRPIGIVDNDGADQDIVQQPPALVEQADEQDERAKERDRD